MTVHYNFDTPYTRKDTDSLKWSRYGADVLPMWVADMDFRSPEPVIQALLRRVEHGIFGYPSGIDGSPRETQAMRQAIVDWLASHFAWQIQPEEILFVPGVVTGFNLACHLFAQPGGAVLVQPPVYYPILHAPANAGLQRVDAELTLTTTPAGLQYKIDFQAFENSITPQTRLFILCSPHNPVGRVFTRLELERMAEICLRKEVFICSDEIHADLIFPGAQHTPLASLHPEIARRTITLMAPSKTFNIPGLEFSFAVIQDANLRQQYQQVTKGLVGWINCMGWVAAHSAYREGQEWLDQLLVYLEANRNFLYDYIQREIPEISLTCPEGTYLAWLDCRALALQPSPHEFFLNHARVAFNDGKSFGSGGEGFVRLNFGCPRSTLEEALQRIKAALQTH